MSTNANRSVTVAVISDVHAYSSTRLKKGAQPPSYVEISDPAANASRDPFLALENLISTEQLRADVLINCGDLGDKAQPDAIRYTWTKTRELATALKTDKIFATAGNHDVDSRGDYTDHDARGTLVSLPEFPFSDSALNNEYWARNVVVTETETVRWAILNSAAYHGFKDEHEHGRISGSTLEYLRDRLRQSSNDKLNILVCHHHVYKINNIDLSDYSAMVDSSALLSLLENDGFGNWMVFHGHRHWPSLSYAPGGSNAPVVFAAGSLSATLWADLAGRARNQFYIFELEYPPALGRTRGTFRAWDFTPDVGFVPAQDNSGLPHHGGFGSSITGTEIAHRINDLFEEQGVGYLEWSEVLKHVPDIRHSLPDDMRQCVKVLAEKFDLTVLRDRELPRQVGRT